MFHRLVHPASSKSFFLFGARGTGKSTFIKTQWKKNYHYINLLLERFERRYQENPDLLIDDLAGLRKKPEWIVIDEIQKVPKLLDVVHELIETSDFKFGLTGSSARKLKKMSANMLAGRAFYNQMFPLTHIELGKQFVLDEVLHWGSLPEIVGMAEKDRIEYLRSYCQSYLREEILQEQIVRNGVAFRNFLEISAQENGKTINFTKIANDVHAEVKTIQNYFQILEDTLIGYLLPAYTASARKSVKHQPKFYLFDLGIKRALEHNLQGMLMQKSYAYGNAFEHFVILECIRLNSYCRTDFQFYHYQTTAGGEIDLILRQAKKIITVEIKSTTQINVKEVHKLQRVSEALQPTQCFFVSQDRTRSKIGSVMCLHWKDFLCEIFKN